MIFMQVPKHYTCHVRDKFVITAKRYVTAAFTMHVSTKRVVATQAQSNTIPSLPACTFNGTNAVTYSSAGVWCAVCIGLRPIIAGHKYKQLPGGLQLSVCVYRRGARNDFFFTAVT